MGSGSDSEALNRTACKDTENKAMGELGAGIWCWGYWLSNFMQGRDKPSVLELLYCSVSEDFSINLGLSVKG